MSIICIGLLERISIRALRHHCVTEWNFEYTTLHKRLLFTHSPLRNLVLRLSINSETLGKLKNSWQSDIMIWSWTSIPGQMLPRTIALGLGVRFTLELALGSSVIMLRPGADIRDDIFQGQVPFGVQMSYTLEQSWLANWTSSVRKGAVLGPV